jgi:hypothetical protein
VFVFVEVFEFGKLLINVFAQKEKILTIRRYFHSLLLIDSFNRG